MKKWWYRKLATWYWKHNLKLPKSVIMHVMCNLGVEEVRNLPIGFVKALADGMGYWTTVKLKKNVN